MEFIFIFYYDEKKKIDFRSGFCLNKYFMNLVYSDQVVNNIVRPLLEKSHHTNIINIDLRTTTTENTQP